MTVANQMGQRSVPDVSEKNKRCFVQQPGELFPDSTGVPRLLCQPFINALDWRLNHE